MKNHCLTPFNFILMKEIKYINHGIWIAILTGILLPLLLPAQVPESRYERQLQPPIEQVMKKQGIPGLAIAIVEDGELVYAKGFGVKSLYQTYDPVTTRSLFHMASVTKTFVATAVMQLVDLDTPVVSYLPYFQMDDERYTEVTVRQLLNHTSGMPDEYNYEWENPQYDEGALERYVRGLEERSLVAAPGTMYRYSNIAYEVLGALIARVSAVSFETYVAGHILEPLGMENSTLLLKATDPGMLTQPHVLDRDYNVSVSAVFPYNRAHAPSSTLYSSVLDISRWARAILNRGQLDNKRILSFAGCDEMWKEAGEQWPHAGLGWVLGEYKGHRSIGHSGGDLGFASNMVLLPGKNIAVIIMSNYERAAVQQLITVALDVALNLAPSPMPGIDPLITDQILYRTIRQDGIEAAIDRYYELKSQPPGFDFNQVRQLNRLGYNLLNNNKIREAIEIFKLNTAAYPALAFVYDSLAEAYLRNGDSALAIESYQKALELNPNSTNASEMLRKLKTP